MKQRQPRILTDGCSGEPGSTHTELLHGTLTREVLGAFYTVYNELRYGYLESVYRNALVLELRSRGLTTETEAALAVRYKNHEVGHFRADVLVESCVVVELKACHSIGTSERQQLLNY